MYVNVYVCVFMLTFMPMYMVFVYRCLHNLYDVTLEDIGLVLSHNNERSGKASSSSALSKKSKR